MRLDVSNACTLEDTTCKKYFRLWERAPFFFGKGYMSTDYTKLTVLFNIVFFWTYNYLQEVTFFFFFFYWFSMWNVLYRKREKEQKSQKISAQELTLFNYKLNEHCKCALINQSSDFVCDIYISYQSLSSKPEAKWTVVLNVNSPLCTFIPGINFHNVRLYSLD